MQISRFVVNMVQENCYLVWDETREAVLIDCGALYEEEQKAIVDFVRQHQLKVVRLLNTHGHFDHVFGAQFVNETFGVRIEMCADEKETYEQAAMQMKGFLHVDCPFNTLVVENFFKDGDELMFGNTVLKVIATPGHTPGGVCFYCESEGVLFSGDSLFKRSIGRCDLPGGNENLLISSLKERVLTLPEKVQVLPGHGDMTTIAEEKRLNYYLK